MKNVKKRESKMQNVLSNVSKKMSLFTNEDAA